MVGNKIESNAFMVNHLFTEYIEYVRSIITIYEKENEDKYKEIKKDLEVLIEKINDNNIYLGVVGSFSSGKSMFINSLIHKDLLPTDAVQGTTVATSIIKKADFNDLEIIYKDGKIVKFSESQDDFYSKYEVAKTIKSTIVTTNQSFMKKITARIKKFFLIRRSIPNNTFDDIDIEECILFFKKIISTEELAINVNRVTLYCRNIDIPNNIALVDTPGTESLNKRHTEVAQEAINNMCNVIVVIIPYDKPASEDLIEYINDNISEYKSECIFVVTKVEWLNDKDEILRLIRVIKQRLENGLSTKSVCVIPMPTLVYLSSVDTEMKTTLFNDMSDIYKNELISMYEEGSLKIYELLEQNKNDYIKKKIISICYRVNLRLKSNLSEVIKSCDKEISLLQNRLVIPLNEFKQSSENDIIKCCNINRQLIEENVTLIQVYFSDFSSQIEKKISECNDLQQLQEHLVFSISFCNSVLMGIQKDMYKTLSEIRNLLNNKLEKIKDDFYSNYKNCDIDSKINQIVRSGTSFFSDEFESEYYDFLQEGILDICLSIQNGMYGLFKIFKKAKMVDKYKNIAWNDFSEIICCLRNKTKDYCLKRIDQILFDYKKKAIWNLNKMIDDNRCIIEGYINNTKKTIKNNSQNKMKTEKHIERLNQYINTR